MSDKEMTAAQMLYDARTAGRRKREIQTIAKLLCIREEYLEALEQGKYDKIPELVYVLGFARNYAMELGLDADEIMAKIKREMGITRDDDEITDTDIANVAKNGGMRIGNHTFEKISRFVIKRWKWIAVAVVAILILVFGILFVANLSNDAVAPDVAPEIVMTEPEYKTSVRERFGTENKDSAIILQATSESWVKIEDARGNTVFSRVLVPGDVYFVPNGDGYRGTFGNVGGVDVWVNGNLIAKLGELNARKSGIIMSPEGLTTP